MNSRLRWSAVKVLAAAALVAGTTAGGITTAVQAAVPTAAPACAPGTTVQTDKGAVCGTVTNGVASWLGIRYAAPPVGNLRWEPPQPAAPWSSTFTATEPGNICPQPAGIAPASTTEDCLNLNVRAPAGAKKLPVMVQFHGGGFRLGAPSDGSHLVANGNVISVEVNYRLGIFGFFAHSALGAHAGDYALQDQQAALRWVRDNIARFGGDPRNVTIFGASAGGSSVCDNSVSPTAKGLFQKGISESGEYNSLRGVDTQWQPQDCHAALPTEAAAQATGARFATAVGCGDAADKAACLRQVPVQTLLDKAGDGLGPDQGTLGPIVNGTTLTMSPGQAFAIGRVNDVSLMIGVARDETQLPSASTPEQYEALVRQQYGSLAPQVFARYPLKRFPGQSAFIAYRTIVADSDAVCPMLLNDQRLSRHIPVYAYEIDDADAPPLFFLDPNKPNGSYHVDEIPFLFPNPGTTMDGNQATLVPQLTAEWTGFARTGNPTVDGTPQWDRFKGNHGEVMSLVEAGDSAMTTETAKQHNCDFWNAFAPFNH